jgi:hypothetical protein
MADKTIQWLLECDEPWTRYRTRVDLLGQPETDSEVRAARAEMLAHPQIRQLMAEAAAWPGPPLKRHNDASHPLYKLSTLADFGALARDRGTGSPAGSLAATLKTILAHQSPQGAFQTLVNISAAHGGTGEDIWTWMACDAPTLLHVLLAMGKGDEGRVKKALAHLTSLVEDNGWRCAAAPEIKFRGPGRKADPCPIANVYALKALAQAPDARDGPAAHTGAEMLLSHWERQKGNKYYLFGIGTDFRKLKYPFVWYDLLHVADVLSRFTFVRADARFRAMVKAITAQADAQGRYTAGSMYQAWKGWSFADKKQPSPWLTCMALRIIKRAEAAVFSEPVTQ